MKWLDRREEGVLFVLGSCVFFEILGVPMIYAGISFAVGYWLAEIFGSD